MADSLGRLELGLGVDLPGLESGLVAADRAIERYKVKWQQDTSLSGLTIKPAVDDSALTALNKHLSLKQSHLAQVRSDFAKPLMVAVDYTSLDEFSRKLDRLHKQQQKGFGFSGGQTNLNIEINTNGLARSVQRGVEKGFKDVGSGGILASIGRGAFEGLGRELFGGISKSFSSQIDLVLSSTIGSSDLLGKKLAEKAGSGVQNLASRARNASPVVDGLITQASSSIRGFVGDRDIAIEVNRKRGRDQRAADRNLKLAREGIVGERQQSTQEFDSAYEDLRAIKQRLAPIQARVDRRDAPNQARLREIEQQKQAEISRLAKDKKNQIRQLQERQATASPIERSALSNQISSISSRELVSPQLAKLEFDRKQIEIKRAPIQRIQDTIDENLESRAARFATAKNRKETATRQTESLFPQSQPKVYQDLLDELAPKLKDRLVPKLVSDPTLKNRGANGDYAVASNTIRLNPDTYKAVQSGKPLSDKDYKILYEELKHASDLKFGQFEGLQSRASGRLIDKPIKASPQEEAAIASELNAYRKEDRPFERQAKIARDRSLPKYQARRSLENINEVAGLSGLDYLKTTNQAIGTTDSLLGSISSAVGKNNIDAPSLARIQAKQEQLKAARVKILEDIQSAQAGDLSRDKILKLEVDLDRNIAEIESTKRRTVGLAKGITTARSEESEDLWAVNKGSKLLPNRRNQRRRSPNTSQAQPIGDLSIWEDRVESVVPEIVAPEKESFFNRPLLTAKSVGGFIRKVGTPVAQVARNGYDALEGAENAVAPYVPFFKQIKAVGKNVVLPAAAYGALGMVPGGEVVQGALGDAAHGLLSLPGAGAVDAVTSAVGSAVGGIPMIGEALTAGAGTLTAGAVDTIVTTMTPIVAGKVALKLVGKGAQLALPTKKAEYDYVEAGQNTANKAISSAANLTETTYERLPGVEESLALPPAKKGSLVQAANKASSNSLNLKPAPKVDDDLMPIESSSSLLNNARTGLRNIRRKLKDAVDKGNISLATQLDKQFGEQLDLFEKFSSEKLVGKGASSDSRLNISNWRNDRAKFAKKIELVREDKDDFAPLNSIDLSPRSSRPLRSFRPQPQIKIPAIKPDDFESQFQPLAALSRGSQRRKRANIQAGQKRRSVVEGEFVDESALTMYRGELAPIPGDVRERLNVDPRSIPPPPPPRPNFATDGEFVDPVRRKRQRRLPGEARQRVNAQAYESPQNYPQIPDPFDDNGNDEKKDPNYFRSFRKKISDARDLREQQGRSRRGAKPRNILDPNQYPEDAAYEASNNAESASSEFDRAEKLIKEREARNLYGANRIAAGGIGGGGNPPDALSYGIDRLKQTITDIDPNPLGKLGDIAKTTTGAFFAFQGLKFVGGMIGSWGDAATKTALAMETLTIGTKAVSETNYAAAQSISRSQGLSQKLGFNPLDTLKGVQGFKAATQDTEIQGVSDDIFASAQKYGRLIGQSSQSQGQSLRQLQQIGSKSTLTYEDVAQLSDSLPGASTKIAQGLGTNASGLRKLTASGGVSGTEALIGLKQGFDAATASGLDESLNSTTASLGRLEGSITKLQGAVGQNLLAPLGAGAKLAGGAIDGAADNADMLGTILVAALIAAGAQGLIFAGKMGLAALGISGLGAAATAVAPALATFVGVTAGIYAFAEAFKAVSAQLDNTNPMSSYADAAERMVARLNVQKGSVDDLRKSLSELATEAANERFNKDRPLLSAVNDTFENLGRQSTFITFGKKDTFAERKAKQTETSLEKAQVKQDEVLKATPVDLVKFSAEKEKIDLEIKRLNVEQAITPAGDRGKLGQLQKALQDQQANLIKVTEEPIKRRGEYDSIARQAKEVLTDPLYANNPKEQEKAKEQLAIATQQSALLDKEISKVRDGLSELAVSLRQTSGALGNSLESIGNAKLERETKFNNSGANPLDAGAKASFQFANAQSEIRAKIAAFETSKSESQKSLNNPVIKTQVEQFQRGKLLPKDLITTTDEQLSGIKSDGASDSLVNAIKAYRDASKQIKSLSNESASGSREFQSAIAENARSVRDYNQTLAYNAQKLTVEYQQTEQSLQSQDYAGKLRSALAGVNDRFSAYFNTSIDILLESGKSIEAEATRRKAQIGTEENRTKALQDNEQRQQQTQKPLDQSFQPTGASPLGGIASPIPGVNLANIGSYNPGDVGLFGAGRKAGSHKGLDFKAPAGTPVMASFDGTATLQKNVGYYGGVSKSKVILEGIDAEGKAIRAAYFHMGEKSWGMFGAGQKKAVKAGEIIGDVGKDGNLNGSVGEHLHYELRRAGRLVDPKKGLAQLYDSVKTAPQSSANLTTKPILMKAPADTMQPGSLFQGTGVQSAILQDLSTGKVVDQFNSNKSPRAAASTSKLLLLEAVWELIKTKPSTLNEKIKIDSGLVAQNDDSFVAGQSTTLGGIIESIAKTSSNTGSNVLIDRFGKTAINKKLVEKGRSQSNIENYYNNPANAKSQKDRNTSTAKDINASLVDLYKASDPTAKLIRESLENTDHKFGYKGEIGGKIGNTSQILGNAGIVEIGEKKYALTQYYETADSPQARKKLRTNTNQVISKVEKIGQSKIANSRDVSTVSAIAPNVSPLSGLANFIGKRESNNNYYALQGSGSGSFPKSAAIGGFPKGLENQNIGRYQFNKSDFNSSRKVDPTITGFTPEDQDKIFRVKAQQRAGKELAAFQSNSSEANADRLRVALGQEWEVLRDGKVRYRGKDTGRNYFGGDKSKREFYQGAMSRPQLGTVSAGLANALLPGASYDVAPPTALSTNTTADQNLANIQAQKSKVEGTYKAETQLNNAREVFAKADSITKLESLRTNQLANDRKLKRQDDDRVLADKRRSEDRQLTTGYDTPDRVIQRQTVANERTASDTTRDLTRTREDLTFSAAAGKKLQGRIDAGIKDKSFARRSPEEQTQIKQISADLKVKIPQLEAAIAAYDKLISQSAQVSKQISADAKTKAGDRQQALNTSTDASVIKGLISLKQEQVKTIEIFQKDRPTDFSKGDPLVLKKEIAILQAQSIKLTETQALRERRRNADPANQKKIDGEIANVGKVADKSITNANAEFISAKEQRDIGFTTADIERQRARTGSFGTLGAAQVDLFKVQRKTNPFDYSKPISSIEGSYQIAAEDSRYATAKREIESRSRIDKSQAAHFAELARLEDERHVINMKSIGKSIDLAEIEEQIQGQRVSFDRAQFNTGLELGTSSSRAGLVKAQRKDTLAQDIEDETGRKKIRSEYDAAVQSQIEILQRSPDDPSAKGTFVGRVQELNTKRQLDIDTIDAAKVTRDREKVFNQGSLLSGSRSTITSAEGERASLAGNNFDARNINYRSAVIGQGQEFRTKQKELEDLHRSLLITTDQFKFLSDELTQLNEIKLDNLARQFSPVTDAIKGVSDKFSNLLTSVTDGSMDAGKSLREFLASPFKLIRDEANKYLTSALSNQLTKWLKPDLAKNVPAIEPRKLLGNPEVLGPIKQPSIAVPSPKLNVSLEPILPPIKKTPDLGFTIPPAPTRENTVGSPIYAPNVLPAPIGSDAENPPPSTYLIRVGNSIVDRRTLPSYQPSAISAPIETPGIIPGSPFFQPRSLDQIQSSSAPTPVSIVSDLTPPKNAPANISIAGGGGGDFGSKLTRGVGSTLLRGISGGGFSPMGILGGLISGLFADGGIVGDELMDLPAYERGGIHSPHRFQHGIIPGYSPKDDTLAVVMRGEAFLTQRATARLGKDGVDALNRGETPPIFLPNFSLGVMPELPRYENGGIHGGMPNMSAAAISSATSFGDNISNIGGSPNYSFVMNNSGGGSSDVGGTIDHKDIVRSEMMDMLMRLKRQGVIA